MSAHLKTLSHNMGRVLPGVGSVASGHITTYHPHPVDEVLHLGVMDPGRFTRKKCQHNMIS